jgi:hypothetical protein
MKTLILAIALAASSTAGIAYAADSSTTSAASGAMQSQQWSAAQSAATPKTRAEVRRELVRAEQDGQLARLNSTLYRGS